MVAVFGSITITHRSYFSSYHLWSARYFLEQIKSIEDSHEGRPVFNVLHLAMVINCIVSITSFAEAAINEVYKDSYENYDLYIRILGGQTISKYSAYWINRLSGKKQVKCTEKYQDALSLANLEKMDLGRDPYQSLDILFKLRNSLIHYSPDSLPSSTSKHFTENLIGKFDPCKLYIGSENPFFSVALFGVWLCKMGR